jgi:ElaB/YqjD/DUF883 family membrane-anchored ribosome-binding protein
VFEWVGAQTLGSSGNKIKLHFTNQHKVFMNSPFHTPAASDVVDSAAHTADLAIRSSQRMANQTLDGMANQVESTRAAAGPALDSVAHQASDLVHRGNQAIHSGAQHLREQAQHAGASTRNYIEHEPLKAVLIAVAAGAALMVLGSLITRGGRSH